MALLTASIASLSWSLPARSHICARPTHPPTPRSPSVTAVASDNNRKAARRKKEQSAEEIERAARAALEAKQQEAAAERALLRAAEERDAVQILRRMGRAGLLPDGEATTLALAAVSQPRLLLQVGGLWRASREAEAELAPEQAARLVRAAAALREWPSVLEWWPMARGVAADDHTECEDAAVRAALALGKFAEAHALLEAAEAAGALRRQPLRRRVRPRWPRRRRQALPRTRAASRRAAACSSPIVRRPCRSRPAAASRRRSR